MKYSDLKLTFGYQPSHHLFRELMGDKWIMDESRYESIMYGKEMISFLEGKTLIALISFKMLKEQTSIYMLGVRPNAQRRGLATTLLNKVIELSKDKGISTFTLCNTTEKSLWRALPANLPAAKLFFEAHSWQFNNPSLDQFGELANYSSPDFLSKKQVPNNLNLKTLEPAESADLLNFQDKNFPDWHPFYKKKLLNQEFKNICIAKIGERIVAACMLCYKRDENIGSNWLPMFGDECVAASALGVDPMLRGKNIAFYLCDFAMQVAKLNGSITAFINKSDAAALYAKYGFKTVWTYVEAQRVT